MKKCYSQPWINEIAGFFIWGVPFLVSSFIGMLYIWHNMYMLHVHVYLFIFIYIHIFFGYTCRLVNASIYLPCYCLQRAGFGPCDGNPRIWPFGGSIFDANSGIHDIWKHQRTMVPTVKAGDGKNECSWLWFIPCRIHVPPFYDPSWIASPTSDGIIFDCQIIKLGPLAGWVWPIPDFVLVAVFCRTILLKRNSIFRLEQWTHRFTGKMEATNP